LRWPVELASAYDSTPELNSLSAFFSFLVCFLGECRGCLYEVMDEGGPRIICNECNAVVSKEDVTRLVLEMETYKAKCPHCGRVNQIGGFYEVFAFVCRYCGEGAALAAD
jgi:hypothetical protein